MTFTVRAEKDDSRVEVRWKDGRFSGTPADLAAALQRARGVVHVPGYGDLEANPRDPLAALVVTADLLEGAGYTVSDVDGEVPEMEPGDVLPPPPEDVPGPPEAERLAEAAAAARTGAMVALYPPPELAAALALDGGEAEKPADLHLTLAFLGDAASLPAEEGALEVVRAWAARTAPLSGVISGVGKFVGGPRPVTYLSVDLPALPEAREDLVAALDAAGYPPSREHGFTPHITLAYASRAPRVRRPIPVTFERVTLAWAEAHTSVPLGGGTKVEEREIWIQPYRRDGVQVSGYWRTVGALRDLINPRSPASRIRLPDGRRIRPDGARRSDRESFIVEDPDGTARRVSGADRLARDVAGPPPEDRPERGGELAASEERMAELKSEAAERFADRTEESIERWTAAYPEGDWRPGTEDTRHVYGRVWTETAADGKEVERWEWTDPDRVSFHLEAAQAMLAEATRPEGRKPVAVFLMGGSAAGKSTLRRQLMNGEVEGPEEMRQLEFGRLPVIDPDRFKEELAPEFQALQDLGRDDAAGRVHEESSDVGELAYAMAVEDGVDFVVDKVGGSSSWQEAIRRLRERGTHDVVIIGAMVDIDTAQRRAAARERTVPPEVVAGAHRKVSDGMDGTLGLGVPTYIYDTSTPADQPPTLIHARDAGGAVLTDSERFLDLRFQFDPEALERAKAESARKAGVGDPE